MLQVMVEEWIGLDWSGGGVVEVFSVVLKYKVAAGAVSSQYKEKDIFTFEEVDGSYTYGFCCSSCSCLPRPEKNDNSFFFFAYRRVAVLLIIVLDGR